MFDSDPRWNDARDRDANAEPDREIYAIHASVVTTRVMRCFTISISHGDSDENLSWTEITHTN
jgi:hypothetical protein